MGMTDLLMMGGLGSAGALVGVALVGMLIAFVALYIYMALVLSTLANKMKLKDKAWLAWVPVVNLFLMPMLAGKEWYWGFLLLIPFVNIIFVIWFSWVIFEKRKYPGWLSLITVLTFIPVIGALAALADLILWGLVAWKDR